MASKLEKHKLDALSEDEKAVAFQKAKVMSMIPGGHIVRITKSYYDDAIAILKHSLSKDEPLCKSVNFEWDQTVQEWWIAVLSQNLSLLAIDEISQRPIGVLCIENPKQTVEIDVTNTSLKHILAFFGCCDEDSNFEKHFQGFEIIHMLAVSVLQEYRREGVGRKLCQTALSVAKEYREYTSSNIVLKSECTSNYTKKILESMDFKCLYEQFYDAYLFDDEIVFKDTGEHKSVKLMVKEI